MDMEGPRAPKHAEFSELVSFLDENLRPKEKWSITDEYPTALNSHNIHNIRIIKSEDQYLSHAVLKPMILKTPKAILKVGAIGSVVTDSEHRHQGLSRTVIEDCIAKAVEQDCDIAILWSDLIQFYQKIGFELAGTEVSVTLENEEEVPSEGLRFIEGTQVSLEPLLKLYSRHTVSTVRTLQDLRGFLAIPQTRLFTAWDQSGQLQAYAVEGKGADLQGYIHEWGGQVSALVPLFYHIRKKLQKPVVVITPHHATNLIRHIENYKTDTHYGHLGMVRILNEEQIFKKIDRVARAIGVSDLVLERVDNGVRCGRGDDVIELKSRIDLTRFLFGPERPSRFLKSCSVETIEAFEQILPFHLWIWGWDSI